MARAYPTFWRDRPAARRTSSPTASRRAGFRRSERLEFDPEMALAAAVEIAG